MPTSIGFTGQRVDSVTGLDYYMARYYDPGVGQFLSADSVQGNAQGMDPYAYVGGNPETKTDPTGHIIPCEGDCAGIGKGNSGEGSDNGGGIDLQPPQQNNGGDTGGDGSGSGSGTTTPTGSGGGNPKIVRSPRSQPNTNNVCNDACGRRDKTLILNEITNIEEGRNVLIATAVGDGLALVSDGIAAALDAVASDWTGFGVELVSALARAAALTGDLGKLGVFSIPTQVSDLLQGLKIIANILDTFEGILNLVNPVAGVAKQAASFATQIVKPAVQAGILQLIASAASVGAGTGYQKFGDAFYYDSLRARINGDTDQQAYDACIHQYLPNDPGEC